MASWKEELQSQMIDKAAGKETSLLCFDIIDSTNLEAVRQAQAGAKGGLWIVADAQSQGKGRRGRSWESPAGSNVFMSLLLRPFFLPDKASMVTLVMALSVAQAIREATGLAAEIKWPNDIVINRKKAVGILTELAVSEGFIQHLVCGVGINVNQEEFLKEISQTATSLFLESGREVDRVELIIRVMERFEENYKVFCRKQNMADLLPAYHELLVNKDAEVRVLDPKGEYRGIARGINIKGELLVEKEDGSIEEVYAGEVSVRGIYGYV